MLPQKLYIEVYCVSISANFMNSLNVSFSFSIICRHLQAFYWTRAISHKLPNCNNLFLLPLRAMPRQTRKKEYIPCLYMKIQIWLIKREHAKDQIQEFDLTPRKINFKRKKLALWQLTLGKHISSLPGWSAWIGAKLVQTPNNSSYAKLTSLSMAAFDNNNDANFSFEHLNILTIYFSINWL